MCAVSFPFDRTMESAIGFANAGLPRVVRKTNTTVSSDFACSALCRTNIVSFPNCMQRKNDRAQRFTMLPMRIVCLSACVTRFATCTYYFIPYAMRNEHISLTMGAHMRRWCRICNSCETSYHDTDYFSLYFFFFSTSFWLCQRQECAFSDIMCDENINERSDESLILFYFPFVDVVIVTYPRLHLRYRIINRSRTYITHTFRCTLRFTHVRYVVRCVFCYGRRLHPFSTGFGFD